MFQSDFIVSLGIKGSDPTFMSLVDRVYKIRKNKSTYCLSLKFKALPEHHDMIDVTQYFSPKSVFQIDSRDAILEFEGDNYAQVTADYGDEKIFSITAIGEPEWVRSFKKNHRVIKEGKVFIAWYYAGSHGMVAKEFEIEKPLPVYDEYYPYVEGGIENYIDNYLNSNSSILIMIGEPGTGKTSLIRHMLYSRKLQAQLTFDEKVMAMENYYIDYAASSKYNLMIIEDADLLLESRRSAANKLMSRLLNISDGLVKLDRKKMIFTTNLSNVNMIDPALIRSGRCYDVLQFHGLTNAQAAAAANKAGIELATNGRKEVTLAEVFSKSKEKDPTDILRLRRTA